MVSILIWTKNNPLLLLKLRPPDEIPRQLYGGGGTLDGGVQNINLNIGPVPECPPPAPPSSAATATAVKK